MKSNQVPNRECGRVPVKQCRQVSLSFFDGEKTVKGKNFFINDLSFPQNAADKCLLSKMHLNVKSFEELQSPQSADNLASASESLGLRLLILLTTTDYSVFLMTIDYDAAEWK